MIKTSKFALAYTRVAKDHVGHPSESITHQKQAIDDYAMKNGYTITKYLEHVNRSDLNNNLEWLDQILSEEKKIGYVLVYSYDRLTPSVCNFIELRDYLINKYDVSVVAKTSV
jgi:DNA invertase Pin-like site-specific DNA recombinase